MYNDAVEIVKTLTRAGFTAYFAGGWVRDFVLKHPSTDIDIATNATPDQVIALFPKTIPIGKAFGVVLVMMNEIGYEVASFRKDDLYIDGRRPTSVSYSTPEEDAARRDFTINGLFYNPVNDEILDFVGGVADIEQKKLEAIGDPNQRFCEDKLRMIRAVRFSVKLGFRIEEKTEQSIKDFASSLYPSVSKERVLQELKKMGEHHSFPKALFELKRLGLLDVIFPLLTTKNEQDIGKMSERLKNLSPEVPFLLILSSFFADFDENQILMLFEDLKLSSQEKLDLLFAIFCQKLIKKEAPHISKQEWVQFFSHPLSRPASYLLRAMSNGFTTELFSLTESKLLPHIERKRKGITLLSSKDLSDAGILPGKSMGLLLKEGEKLAIDRDLKSSSEVLELLKQSNLWVR